MKGGIVPVEGLEGLARVPQTLLPAWDGSQLGFEPVLCDCGFVRLHV
jgi:hypothetical protein